MSASFYDLMKYAKTGVASPSMTAYDKLKAVALCGGGFPVSTISGVPPISFKSDGSALTAWSITGDMVQTGTPTPSAPIQPQETGDRTGNLFDRNNEVAGYMTDEGVFVDGGVSTSWYVSQYIPVSGETGYTFTPNTTSGYSAKHCYYNAEKEFIGNINSGEQTFTTPSNAKFMRFSYRGSSTDIMLNLGSSALPYEPYGYKLPLTLGQTHNVYLSEPIRKIGDYADVASATGTSGVATRKICKLVLTGEENIESKSGNARWYIPISGMKKPKNTEAVEWVCSHYQAVSNAATWANYDYMISWSTSDSGIAMGLRIRDIDYLTGATVTDFKTYLAQQYANGTPVTVWYVLATPETETFTAPTLKPANGNNTLTVDTTLPPSGVSITGRIKPE